MKTFTALVKSQPKTPTVSFLTGFAKFRRSSRPASQGLFLQGETRPGRTVVPPLFPESILMRCLLIYLFLSHSNTENGMTSGYETWPYNHVFFLSIFLFLGEHSKPRSLINYCSLKISGISQILKVFTEPVTFSHFLFYKVIYPTGTSNEANKHKCKRKDKRRLKITIKFFTRKKIQKLAFAPAYEGMRGRVGKGIEKKIKTK